MRPYIRARAAGVPTQPTPGERYLKCRHVRGDTMVGFNGAHILYIQGSGPSMSRYFERRPESAVTLAVRWLVLCDRCYQRHDSGEDDGVFEGSDHEWPEGAEIVYLKDN